MKTKYFFMFALVILVLVMVLSSKQKEGFMEDYCSGFNSCMDCSSASGCSWCPRKNACLTSTTLKSTDANCNQDNTIASSFRCPSADPSIYGPESPNLPEEIASNDVLYDLSLYKNRITDKIPPPNLYMAGKVDVSNEDLLSNMNDIRNDITNYKEEMPGIIAGAVEGQIKPMVKGILAENYYIQGFEDFNKCSSYNSCSNCVGDDDCGWDPRRYSCGKRGPNSMWQIIQPSRCTLTPSTQTQMVVSPGGNV
jgi:hypothetical protein